MKVPHFSRFIFLGIVFGVVGLAIVAQMVRIQSSSAADQLRAQSEMYQGEYRTVYPERGNIYDRWGHLLAGNETVYEIGVDLQMIGNRDADPEAIAATLASVLGTDYVTIRDAARRPYIEGQSVYAVLTDFVTPEKVDELLRIKKQYADQAANARRSKKPNPTLNALTFTPHLKRSYPEHTLASNVLGFFSYLDRDKGRGYFGVEEKYNDLLAGTPLKVYIPFDPNEAQDIPEVPPGSSLILTIDREIQTSVEKILDEALVSTGAEAGTIIVTDPKNGEILGMATTPRLDLNEYWKYAELFPNPTPYNRAVGTTYEPGSVFKVLTMASALDNGSVTPETPFLDTGVFEIGGAYVHNWDGGAWGPQDMVGCMQHSLNVCLAWVASQLGPTNFYNYLQTFGIGHTTGIDLAGEATYPIRLPGDGQWLEMDLGTNSFGQGIAVTPIQMVMAVSALANEGKMMAPHMLHAMVNNGRQYDTPPQVVGTPIKPETARTITQMLSRSLESESSDALIEGYRVAGKTGTAEIPTEYGYSSDLTNASFVGWGPIDNPRFLVYVWLERPRASIWGSVVAAPVFRDVVKSLVVLMDIPPDEIRQQLNGQ